MTEEFQAKAALITAMLSMARDFADMCRDDAEGVDACRRLSSVVLLLDEAGPLAAQIAPPELTRLALWQLHKAIATGALDLQGEA